MTNLIQKFENLIFRRNATDKALKSFENPKHKKKITNMAKCFCHTYNRAI